VTKYGRYFVVRCEKKDAMGERLAVHYFPTDPFDAASDTSAVKHLQEASKHAIYKCHDDEAVRTYSNHEIVKKYGYEGTDESRIVSLDGWVLLTFCVFLSQTAASC